MSEEPPEDGRMHRVSRSLTVVAVAALAASAFTAPAAATSAVGIAQQSVRTVTLITGDGVAISRRAGHVDVAFRAARHSGIAASSTILRAGSSTYVVPGAARRYLGRVLDKSLFDLSALTGRPAHLPVTVTLAGSTSKPTAPGLVITSRSGTTAQGYLDAARATAFGDALAAQWKQDAAAHRTPTSIMGGIAHLALAGVAPPVQPNFPQVTLILKAIDVHGRPADGVVVGLLNVDDGRKYVGLAFIDGGQANLSVPKGHYSLMSEFDDFSGDTASTQLVPVSDFDVTTNRQVFTIDARRATVTPRVTTPRPADVDELDLEWDRTAGLGGFQFGAGGGPGSTVRVAPTRTSPYGTTDWVTGWILSGTPTSGNPYTYNLSYDDVGLVPADQSRAVAANRLATVTSRYYSDGTVGVGAFGRGALYPFEFLVFTSLLPLAVPSVRTEYVLGPPAAVWINAYNSPSTTDNPFGGTFVNDGLRVYAGGTSYHADWLNGALTPGIPEQQSGDQGFGCYACRDATNLSVALQPTIDSDPGHAGFPSADVRFRVWRNGTSLFDQTGFYGADLTVPRSAATYRVREDIDRTQDGALLSTQVSTDVTFRSAAGQGGPLPDGWFCDFEDTCLVLPMLAARIPLPTDLSGAVPSGPATITFTVRHIEGAKNPTINSVGFGYAVNGGSWRSAAVQSLGGNRYRAVVSAPRSSVVSVRVTATDVSGGSLVQTATDAYRVAGS